MQAIAIKSGETVIIYHNMALIDTTRTTLLIEKYAGKHQELPKGYSLRYDVARLQNCQDHIHIFRRNNQIGAVNIDGSRHDNSNFQIPKTVANFVQQNYSDFVIPNGRLVEASLLRDDGILHLLEDVQKGIAFKTLLVIDLDEIDEISEIEEDDDMVKRTKELLDYFANHYK
ncbi:MAG: hypothetical protein FVQ79_03565 [Planctomycetes bacterium]|nr:hypothetical protein [Planctomycetota bacterium]